MARSLLVALLVLCQAAAAGRAESPGPLGPSDLAVSADGTTLYATLHDAAAVAVVDVSRRSVVKTLPCPEAPNGICRTGPEEQFAVACGSAEGVVALIDGRSGEVTGSIPVGHTPRAPVAAPDGRLLYVCNQLDASLSVIDRSEGRELARIPVAREPFDAALTPDGATLVVVHLIPDGPANRADVAASVSLVETATRHVRSVPLPAGSTGVHGVCVTPDGRYALAVHLLARFHLPTTQLDRGWMTTNALSVIDLGVGTVVGTVLLDEISRGAANPWDVAMTADGRWICVSHAGTHELSVIDAPGFFSRLLDPAEGGNSVVRTPPADDLTYLSALRQRVALAPTSEAGPVTSGAAPGKGPRGLAVVGTTAYVAAYFGDELLGVSLDADPAGVQLRVPLGPPTSLSEVRRGELLFHDATIGFQGWQSCATCHPGKARVDGLNWDLLNDGLGNPKNTRSLLLAHSTPPTTASGVRNDAEGSVRAGFHHILFVDASEPDAQAVDAYLKSLRPEPGPALVNGKPSPAAERGRQLFESDRLGCAACHPGPLYTDLEMHDVGSRGPLDDRDTFDTPTLVESWRTGPYLHDGRYATLHDLFREGHHGDVRGDVDGLTDEELEALIEFLRTL